MSYDFGKEHKIASVDVSEEVVDIGAQESKALPPGSRYRYVTNAKYVLEDGTAIDSCLRGLTKPKLKERIESTRNNIKLGCMFAQQITSDAETYWSLSTKFSLSMR